MPTLTTPLVRTLAAVTVALSLSACERVEQVGAILSDAPLPVVIAPGYEVAIDGKPVGVFGFDLCPSKNPGLNQFVGTPPAGAASNCIVVTPKLISAKVRLEMQSGAVQEEWAIVRTDKGGMYFRRPNGSLVESYAKFSSSSNGARSVKRDAQGA